MEAALWQGKSDLPTYNGSWVGSVEDCSLEQDRNQILLYLNTRWKLKRPKRMYFCLIYRQTPENALLFESRQTPYASLSSTRWRWVWNNVGMILTGENWSTGRKPSCSVGGRWMTEYGALVEWHWQGKLKCWRTTCSSAIFSITNPKPTSLGTNCVLAVRCRLLHGPKMCRWACRRNGRDENCRENVT